MLRSESGSWSESDEILLISPFLIVSLMHITQSTMDKITDNIEHNPTYLRISKVVQDIGFDLEAHIHIIFSP